MKVYVVSEQNQYYRSSEVYKIFGSYESLFRFVNRVLDKFYPTLEDKQMELEDSIFSTWKEYVNGCMEDQVVEIGHAKNDSFFVWEEMEVE